MKFPVNTTLVVVLLSAQGLFAQGETIPQQLLRHGGPLTHVRGIPSGRVTIAPVLRLSDTVIRGIVGQPRTYLTDDEREVHTDYPINNPVVLYQTTITQASKPGMPAYTVTVHGGVVTIGGLTFTSKDLALAPLEAGTECLFLLTRIGDQYRIAGSHYGIFQIVDAKLMPLTKKEGFAPEYRGAPAEEATRQIVTQLYALRSQ